MATMKVSLPDAMLAWVEGQTRSGRYPNASEYVRDLIRRDQDRAAKIATMQRLVDEGLASGAPEEFDFDAFTARMREQHAGKTA